MIRTLDEFKEFETKLDNMSNSKKLILMDDIFREVVEKYKDSLSDVYGASKEYDIIEKMEEEFEQILGNIDC